MSDVEIAAFAFSSDVHVQVPLMCVLCVVIGVLCSSLLCSSLRVLLLKLLQTFKLLKVISFVERGVARRAVNDRRKLVSANDHQNALKLTYFRSLLMHLYVKVPFIPCAIRIRILVSQ
jgi:hypothetical protein